MAGEIRKSPAQAGLLTAGVGGDASIGTAGGSLWFAIAITAGFAAILFPIILQHAMWRDELQVWQLVRARPGLGQLLLSARYEGHPILWFLMVDAVAHLTADPVAMKVLHAAVASGTVFIVAWRAPWKPIFRAAFALGYFPLFEYGVISRNYSVGVLLGFAACAIIASPKRIPLLLLALVLLLMTQCNVFAGILALALAWGAWVEWLARRNEGREELPRSRMIIAVAVMVVGALILAIELRPASDAGMNQYWYARFNWYRVEATTATLAHVLLPIPGRLVHFWGSNLLDPSAPVGALVAVILGVAAVAVSARRPAALVVLVLCFSGVLGFMYVKVAQWGMRHQGHMFIAFLMGDWLSRQGAPWPARWRELTTRVCDKWANVLLGSLLAVQAATGLWAVERDVQYPFSAGRQTAQYIQQNFPADVPIVGDMDAAASTVAGYLGRSVYYVSGHRDGTYIIWDKKRKDEQVDQDGGKTWAPPDEVIRQAERIAAQRSSDVVIVFSQILDHNMDLVADRVPVLPANVRHVWRSSDAIEADEVYDLYVVSKPVAQPAR